MQASVQLIFHDVEHSTDIEKLVREKVTRLETIFPRLTRCRVSIGRERDQVSRDMPVNVQIALHVPGQEFAMNCDYHGDVEQALRDGFDALRRQLEDYARKMRRQGSPMRRAAMPGR